MSIRSRFIGVGVLVLLLVGGLCTSLRIARADVQGEADAQAESVMAAPRPATAMSVTLGLTLADMDLALGAEQTLDLWTSTVYTGDLGTLVYTATTAPGDYFSATVTGTHYLKLASTSAVTGGDFPVDVTVSDGVLSDTDRFTVSIASAPAVTLTLDVPDVPLENDGAHKVLDFWDYTTYEGEWATLSYTVVQVSWGSYLAFEIVDGHYFSMTSDTTLEKTVKFAIAATDGAMTATDMFNVLISTAPVIDFYGGLDPIDDPVYMYAGQRNVMSRPLEDFASDWEDYGNQLSFAIVNTPPVSAHVSLVTDVYRYVSAEPAADFLGSFPVEVEVRDGMGVTDTDTFTVTVLQQVLLPLAVRNYPLVPYLQPIDNADGDGDYTVRWELPGGVTASRYETEFSFNDPTFIDGDIATIYKEYRHGYFTWPGTHYWRVRVMFYDEGDWVPGPWSNVQSTHVGQFAYLVIDNTDSYAFDLVTRITGNGIDDTVTRAPQDYAYWRSVPVGRYTLQLTSDYIWLCPGSGGNTRNEQITLGNTISGGAWYIIGACNTKGPYLTP